MSEKKENKKQEAIIIEEKENKRKINAKILLAGIGIFSLVFASAGITAYGLFQNPKLVIDISEKYFDKNVRTVEKEIIVKKINENWFKLKQEIIARTFISYNRFLPEDDAKRYAKAVMKAAHTFKVDPFLVTAIIIKESTANYMARSSVAHGLMQVHWAVHKEAIKNAFGSKINELRDLYVPENNIAVGTWILSNYIKSSDGNIKKALGRYYGDPNSSYADKVLNIYLNIVSEFYTKASLDNI